MSDNKAIAEQLQRIEHKMDLILEGQASSNPLTPIRRVGDPEHACPVCQEPVTYRQSIMDVHVVRSCGCATGIIPTNFTFQSIQSIPTGGSYGPKGTPDE
jgi:hypothetical protein